MLLAKIVTLEGGAEAHDTKMAIAGCVINRMNYYGQTLSQVLYANGQFSSVTRVPYTTANEDSISAVRDVVAYGVNIPNYVMFFRASYYHSWGDQTPYALMGQTYFSYSAAVKKALGG